MRVGMSSFPSKMFCDAGFCGFVSHMVVDCRLFSGLRLATIHGEQGFSSVNFHLVHLPLKGWHSKRRRKNKMDNTVDWLVTLHAAAALIFLYGFFMIMSLDPKKVKKGTAELALAFFLLLSCIFVAIEFR